jgi:formamidopyrimidine-DNA glycosylase
VQRHDANERTESEAFAIARLLQPSNSRRIIHNAPMPELPDITIYLQALERRLLQKSLTRITISSPFLLRTAVPPIQSLHGRRVIALQRLGKRIVFGFEGELWLVLHLMIAGRLHWLGRDQKALLAQPPKALKQALRGSLRSRGAGKQAEFEFESGLLQLTEAGTKRRASLHLVEGELGLRMLDPGGLQVMGSELREFSTTLTSENHTLKRALTDPRLFSGIGNAYSDEILHRARLSPVMLTSKLDVEQIKRLHDAVQEVFLEWIARLRAESGEGFPEDVTAFRPEMAVHGKYGQPCPVCGAKVQRIRYADNETNYCPKCQTGGKLLADRSLSLLLKRDWPKTPEELEEMRAGQGRVAG